eukprot:g79260.t1
MQQFRSNQILYFRRLTQPRVVLDYAWNKLQSLLPPDQVFAGVYVGRGISATQSSTTRACHHGLSAANAVVKRCWIDYFFNGIVIGLLSQDALVQDNRITNSGNDGIRSAAQGMALLFYPHTL